jgi:hypothetical protein
MGIILISVRERSHFFRRRKKCDHYPWKHPVAVREVSGDSYFGKLGLGRITVR